MIKVEVNESGKPAVDYPKLMIAKVDGEIVLFESKDNGTVVNAARNRAGYRSDDWDMDYFTDYDGTVTLSNG